MGKGRSLLRWGGRVQGVGVLGYLGEGECKGYEDRSLETVAGIWRELCWCIVHV